MEAPAEEGTPSRTPTLTLENAVCHYLGGQISPHPVSRLDRGTSGLMAFAKSGYIHERLRRQMHTDAYARVYLGIACGRVDPPRGVIEMLPSVIVVNRPYCTSTLSCACQPPSPKASIDSLARSALSVPASRRA